MGSSRPPRPRPAGLGLGEHIEAHFDLQARAPRAAPRMWIDLVGFEGVRDLRAGCRRVAARALRHRRAPAPAPAPRRMWAFTRAKSSPPRERLGDEVRPRQAERLDGRLFGRHRRDHQHGYVPEAIVGLHLASS